MYIYIHNFFHVDRKKNKKDTKMSHRRERRIGFISLLYLAIILYYIYIYI